MKTLIAYATKHGAAEEIAQKVASLFPDGADVFLIRDTQSLDLGVYDNIVVGGSVYAGTAQRDIKVFWLKNREMVQKKRVGLFLSCMSTDPEEIHKYFESGFGPDFLAVAVAAEALGGKLQIDKLGRFERFIIKMVAKSKPSATQTEISDAKIDGFVRRILHAND